MVRRTGVAFAAGVAALALVVTGCSGGKPAADATSGAPATPAAAKIPEGAITMRGCTPEDPLVATNTNETCGGNVIDAITAKLVHYNADTAAPELDIAASIETKDNQNFTVKLNKGYKFSDGTEVKAKNFVDAWNWAAYGPNAQKNAYFFEPIEGSADVACAADDEKCEKKPKAETMSGLKVVDDYTFTIKTTEKVSNLLVRLGYSAFVPQPDAFFADKSEGKKDFGALPVGAGAYKITANEATGIVLEKNKEYSGKNPASVDAIHYKIYNDPNGAYADLVANQLDLDDQVPSEMMVNDTYKKDLKDRNGQKAVGVFQSITFSPKDEKLKNPKVRLALSMGFDRDLIIKEVFNNSRKPATGFVPPVVDGAKDDQCGDRCKLNVEKAKALLAEGGGYDGPLGLWVNGDGGHQQWADAICNQWRQNLGLDCQVQSTPDFKTLRKKVNGREITGLHRSGWQMDYPSIENFLTPLYGTGASSNDGDYSNKAFDAKLKAAAAATKPAEANQLYQEAEAMLVADMPVIPLWYSSAVYGWSNKIESVKMTPFGMFDLSSIVVKK